jgi:hypothetical protein
MKWGKDELSDSDAQAGITIDGMSDYTDSHPELVADTKRAQRLVAQYNATSGEETEIRNTLLRQLLGSIGDGGLIRPLFACDYGLQHQARTECLHQLQLCVS